MPTEGIERIAAERKRQVDKEGWTPGHDATHGCDELAWAAVCYAAPTPVLTMFPVSTRHRPLDQPIDPWPWDKEWDKRGKHSRIRQLEIAGALIAAKILDRQVAEIRNLYAGGGFTQLQIAERYGVAHQTVSKVVRGYTRASQLGPVANKDQRHCASDRDPRSGRFVASRHNPEVIRCGAAEFDEPEKTKVKN